MYFIVRYNWIDNKLTNKCSVGFFRSLKKASKYCTFNLPYDKNRNTVAIVKIDEGASYYSRPVEVFEWSDTYQVYIPRNRRGHTKIGGFDILMYCER